MEIDGRILAFVCSACFGLNPLFTKLAFRRTDRIDMAVFLGLAVAIPIYLLFLPFTGGLQWERVTPTAFVAFTLGGLFGAGIGRGWMVVAIVRIGASRASALKNTAPLFTTALAILILHEQVSLLRWAAISAIIVGVAALGWHGKGGQARFHWVGFLAGMGSALSYGVRPLFIKLGLESVNLPVTATLVGSIAALTPYAFAVGKRNGLISTGVPLWSMLLFALGGVLQSFGFLALSFALSRQAVSLVYPIVGSAPLFTLGFSRLVLGSSEKITRSDLLGIFTVVAGVAVLSS
ncbi:MAG: DMT family transporter [Chloroflexi bacterium]|nr:DMT family transporter [Chloroflexota bacterium]